MIPSNIIINADDFGLSATKNAAITDAFRLGLINSTSIMTNMDYFDEALELAKFHHFLDKIGVHACLTEGKALSDLSHTSLVDQQGRFIKQQVHKPQLYLSPSLRKATEKEVSTQIEKLLSRGVQITHLNTHHDIHELPWLVSIFLRLAKKYNLKLRVAQTWAADRNFLKPTYRTALNWVYQSRGADFTDFFETVESFQRTKMQKKRQAGLTEIMVHPDLDEKGNIIDALDKVGLKKYLLDKVLMQKNTPTHS